jgi:hypothetical protein
MDVKWVVIYGYVVDGDIWICSGWLIYGYEVDGDTWI